MKNEKMAQAMSYIDYALIEEANEVRTPRAKILDASFVKSFAKYGSLAACFVIILGIMIIARMGSGDVLLYGESISNEPKTITEYMPRSVTHSLEPHVLTSISLPLELDFKRVTKLTLDKGEMTVLDNDGNTLYSGTEYTAKGKVSICLTFPADVHTATINTSRGYNIILTKDEGSGVWYVNIDKK